MAAPVEIQKLMNEDPAQAQAAGGDTSGTNLENPFPHPKVTNVSTAMMDKHDISTIQPVCPQSLKTTYMPAKAGETNWSRIESGTKRQSVIFDNDDRTLFLPQGYPWQTIGKVRTPGGWGSGTVVGAICASDGDEQAEAGS